MQAPVRLGLVLRTPDVGKTHDERGHHNDESAPRALASPTQEHAAKKQFFQHRCRDDAQEDNEEPLDSRRMRRRQTRHGMFFR